VLVEAKLAAGAQHPAGLVQRGRLVGHRAQDQGGDDGVDRLVLHWRVLGEGADDLDGHRSLRGRALRVGAQMALGLDGDDLLNGRGIQREVGAVAAPISTTRPRRPSSTRRRCSRSPRLSAVWRLRR
jgi:hypothetical protein